MRRGISMQSDSGGALAQLSPSLGTTTDQFCVSLPRGEGGDDK